MTPEGVSSAKFIKN
ncbi:hypothetical protein [Bacteroides salyersiae]|nr:hypothetical protein [Bacteroides salyersiae]MCS3057466.1 hypothetical protein [Bacteroides salyersiae]